MAAGPPAMSQSEGPAQRLPRMGELAAGARREVGAWVSCQFIRKFVENRVEMVSSFTYKVLLVSLGSSPAFKCKCALGTLIIL